MNKTKKDSQEIFANLRDEMIDYYADLFKEGYRFQVILAKMQAKWPEYSNRTILEFIKPLRPVQRAVKEGSWVPNQQK